MSKEEIKEELDLKICKELLVFLQTENKNNSDNIKKIKESSSFDMTYRDGTQVRMNDDRTKIIGKMVADITVEFPFTWSIAQKSAEA